MKETIHDRARFRWRGILAEAGLLGDYLSGKHGPCPLCSNGKDRFRFDDKGGNGTWICSHCGAGNGLQMVMKIKGLEFKEAARFIESVIGKCEISIPKTEGRSRGAQSAAMAKLWTGGRLLTGDDLCSRYLRNRGISVDNGPISIRWHDRLPYYEEVGKKQEFPGMLAKFISPDNKWATIHKTYLEEPGVKANVNIPKMLMPGGMPTGGAVRLGAANEVMGIAEGIETALSASQLYGISVWASLSAGPMVRWEPPLEAKHIIIFGDRDESFTGQMAAYELAHKLVAKSQYHVEVRLPWLSGDEKSVDWNDILRRKHDLGVNF